VRCGRCTLLAYREDPKAAKQKPSDAVAIVSYDEKPGIQAIATTAPDRGE
jgi:hypothetical protein